VHGPNDGDRLLQWLLEARFGGLLPGPAPRPCDWPALARTAINYPVAFPAVRVDSLLVGEPPVIGLAAVSQGDQQAFRSRVERALAIGAAVATDQIIIDPGVVPLVGEVQAEDLGETGWSPAAVAALQARRSVALGSALDKACRTLFNLCKSHPDKRFCLTLGRSLRSLTGLEAFTAIFEDLPSQRLRYWHDTAVAARRQQLLGEAQGEWLERFSNRMSGCTLGDSTDEGIYLPPGSGGVDYPLLGTYLPRAAKGVSVCVELDPAVVSTELPGVRDCLDKFGL